MKTLIQKGGLINSARGISIPLETPAKSNINCSKSKENKEQNLISIVAGQLDGKWMALYASCACLKAKSKAITT